MLKVEVKVNLKEGIGDPEGKNILKALHLLGFKEVSNVKVSRVTEMEIDSDNESKTKKNVDRMCRRLLVNPVIHDYSIKIAD